MRSPPTCLSGASTSSSGDDPEAAAHSSSSGMRLDDLDRLAPDRPRGAEEGDSLHALQCRRLCVPKAEDEVVRGRPRRRAARRRGRGSPPWPPSSRPVSLTCMSRFSIDSNRSPATEASTTTTPSTTACQIAEIGVPRVVQRDERDEDAGERADRRSPPTSSPARASARACAARAAGRRSTRTCRPPTPSSRTVNASSRAVVVHVAQQEQVAEAEADPRRAEHRRADRHGRRRSRLRERAERRTRATKVASMPPSIQTTPLVCAAEQRQRDAEVDRGRERPQRPRDGDELVHRDEAREQHEHEQPPAAEPDEAEHDAAGR